MLEDRDYMRDADRTGRGTGESLGGTMKRMRGVSWILMGTIAFYVLQLLTNNLEQLKLPLPLLFPLPPFFPEMYPLSWGAWLFGFATHFMAHGGAGHLLMNMLVLFFMGQPVEHLLRRRAFLRLYLLSALGSALVWLAFRHAAYGTAVLGASGAVYGVVMAAVIMMPNMPVLLFGFIPMKLKWLGVLYLVYDLTGLFGDTGISHLGHIGGAFAGYLVMHIFHKRIMAWKVTDLTRLFGRRQGNHAAHARGKPPIPFPKTDFDKGMPVLKHPASSIRNLDQDELERELDRILEKIGRQGLQSLTAEERRILDLARDGLRE